MSVKPGSHRASTLAHIEEACEDMRNCTFRTGKTIKLYAKKWELSISRVKEITAEASKIVRKELTDPDRVFSILGPALEEAILDCKSSRDFRQLAQLARVYADITGASAPRKIDHAVSNLQGLTREELLLEAKREMAMLEAVDATGSIVEAPQLVERSNVIDVEFAPSEDE